MDGSAVRALAGRVDSLAHGVGEESGTLRSLATTTWTGPAARACESAVGARADRTARLRDDLHAAAALLRAQAAAADRALAALAAQAAGAGDALGALAGAGAVPGAAVGGLVRTGALPPPARGAW